MDDDAESSQNEADKADNHSPDDDKDQDGTPSPFLFSVKHFNNGNSDDSDEVNDEKAGSGRLVSLSLPSQ